MSIWASPDHQYPLPSFGSNAKKFNVGLPLTYRSENLGNLQFDILEKNLPGSPFVSQEFLSWTFRLFNLTLL